MTFVMLLSLGMKTKSDIVENWLPRYTGVPVENLGKYILLTNFNNYVEKFAAWNKVEVQGRDPTDAQRQCQRYLDRQLRNGQPQCRDGSRSAECRRAPGVSIPREVWRSQAQERTRRFDLADRRDPWRRHLERLLA